MKLYPYQKRALDEIKKHNKGTCYIPTGGGKTILIKEDAKNRISDATEPLTFLIVAPRIMLSVQLCDEIENYLKDKNISYLYVHSGEVKKHPISRNPIDIKFENSLAKISGKHHFIFTTYNSLSTVNKSDLTINVVYFDEAHHCTKPSNFVGVAHTSSVADNSYFFTATPRVNNSFQSMNNTSVYGQNIINISAQDLIDVGSIISPKLEIHEYNTIRTKENAAYIDAQNVVEILLNIKDSSPKVLITAPSSKVIWSMFTETDLIYRLDYMGYKCMHITSKHGAYIGKKKVSREVFFNKLNEYGNDPNQKFVLVHYSILSEGMNVDGLTHCILLRNLPSIEMCQTIGRIVRINKEDRKSIENEKIKPGQFHLYKKPHGIIIVPVNGGVGKNTIQKLQNVIDTVFVKGEVVSC